MSRVTSTSDESPAPAGDRRPDAPRAGRISRSTRRVQPQTRSLPRRPPTEDLSEDTSPTSAEPTTRRETRRATRGEHESTPAGWGRRGHASPVLRARPPAPNKTSAPHPGFASAGAKILGKNSAGPGGVGWRGWGWGSNPGIWGPGMRRVPWGAGPGVRGSRMANAGVGFWGLGRRTRGAAKLLSL